MDRSGEKVSLFKGIYFYQQKVTVLSYEELLKDWLRFFGRKLPLRPVYKDNISVTDWFLSNSFPFFLL